MDSQSKQEHLLKIETLINQGDNQQAADSLAKILKKIKLSPLDRVQVSKFYMWFGDSVRALKILGKSNPILLKDLKVDSDELKVELRRAELYYYYGCHILAHDSLVQLKQALPALATDRAFLESQAKVAIGSYNFQLAFESFESLLQVDSSNELYQVGLTDALDGLGNGNVAIERLETSKFTDKKLEAIRLQAIGEYLVKSGEANKALGLFKDSEQLFNENDESKDRAYLYQWRGFAHIDLKQNYEALENLEKAKDMIVEAGAQPTATMACLYGLSLVRPLSASEQACLYLFPTYTPYRQVLFGKKDQSKYPLHPWIASKVKEFPDQLVYFNGSSFELVSKELAESLEVDLKLSRSEVKDRIYIGLLGGSLTGINDVLLWSFVYQENYLDKDIATDKLRKLVDGIKKQGVEIQRKNNAYFLNLESINKKLLINLS